ncbi:hypothetical protein Tco_1037846, partial [Tanacetum coccineum]
FNTTAGNPVKEILLKLNLPDHRSILTDSKEYIKRDIETSATLIPYVFLEGTKYSRQRSFRHSDTERLSRSDEVLKFLICVSMTSNPGTSSSESVSSSQSTDKAPLWDYVTRVSKAVEKGGTWKFTCNFCEETKQGSYSRVRAHLLQISKQGIATCKRVTPTALIEMKKKEKEYEDAKSNSAPKDVPLPCRGQDLENTFKKRKTSSYPLVRAFDVDTRTQLDQEIARMFFTGGLPFNVARNPYYLRAFTFAANQNLGGYVPPGYNKLRTTLLQQEKS